MRINPSPEVIKEIAEQLDTGMNCFYHIPTGEIESYPDELKHAGFDEELWEETMEKVEENYHEYVRFTGMESHESFEIMEDFINEIPDTSLQAKFKNVIQRRKPFQQFKDLLLDYPDLRQQWFAYKDRRNIEYVEEQVEAYNSKCDE